MNNLLLFVIVGGLIMIILITCLLISIFFDRCDDYLNNPKICEALKMTKTAQKIKDYQKCIVKEVSKSQPNSYTLNKYTKKIQELYKQLKQEQNNDS